MVMSWSRTAGGWAAAGRAARRRRNSTRGMRHLGRWVGLIHSLTCYAALPIPGITPRIFLGGSFGTFWDIPGVHPPPPVFLGCDILRQNATPEPVRTHRRTIPHVVSQGLRVG